ncbi:MAG: DNA-processing protein DprA [Minisyncoccia bacterium]|jgi:DNA processing protein
MDKEAYYYNAIAVGTGGDYRKIAGLKKKCGDWKRAYEALRHFGIPPPDAETEWKNLARADVALVLFEHDSYPPPLREIDDHPFGIYLRGALPPQDAALFAIVGTRRATPEGKNIARRFARELAQCGFGIVSGLAFGIDAAAHEGCLDARGATIAVLAGGLHAVYPREHARLAEKILQSGGALVSEYPLGAPPYADRFLARNRIVSGLSRGVVIVEAPQGSGSLATARFALEQNRDVFVVPGSTVHPNFAGSHALIRQGATLTTSPEEIMESYGISPAEKIAAQEKTASPEERLILKALREASLPLAVDKITAITNLEPQIANRTLSFLLLKNLVKEWSEGYTI